MSDRFTLDWSAWPHKMEEMDGLWFPEGVEGPVRVGIMMGSVNDLPAMAGAALGLGDGIGYEVAIMSAHRNPEEVKRYANKAAERGLQVIIAGAGLSAALPGVVAAQTDLLVIGVPLTSQGKTAAGGLDSILSTIQMPPGVPVVGVGLNNAKNAGAAARRIIHLSA